MRHLALDNIIIVLNNIAQSIVRDMKTFTVQYGDFLGPSVAFAEEDAVEGEDDDDMEVADEEEAESEETVSFADQGGTPQQEDQEEEDVRLCSVTA